MAELHINPTRRGRGRAEAASAQAAPASIELLRLCPRYAATPLVELRDLAHDLGLGAVWIKDERARLGLSSFKALGGAYAVLRLAAEQRFGVASPQTVSQLIADKLGAGMVVCAATAGNHGQSVAAGARLIGARAVIFVYEGVPEPQIAVMRRLGAEIVSGGEVYEDAVAACRRAADAEGWRLVTDGAWPGNEAVPALVMEGYGVLAAEIEEQVPQAPTHLFVQCGVGGLAAALGEALDCGTAAGPALVVVEPEAAACVLESTLRGAFTHLAAGKRTNMGRLECYAPSTTAWESLRRRAAAFVTVEDEEAEAARLLLARRGLDTTPSGAAGLAGLVGVCGDPANRRRLGLDADSRVLLVLSEGPLGD